MKPWKLLLIGGSAALAATLVATQIWPNKPQITDLPQTVVIPAGDYKFRASGDFRIGTRTVDAPLENRSASTAFDIMKYPVSEAQYARCVAAQACRATNVTRNDAAAQVDISYIDAAAYAAWFSNATHETWRLPTDDEWVRAAGDRYVDSGLGIDIEEEDPSKRWLANYRSLLQVRGDSDVEIHDQGYFGENNLGVVDISGNVWEWTDSCFINGIISSDGSEILEQTNYCGVRAVQGKHRAFIIDFVRDAKVGGCAVGIPPDYLGFRLVRES